MDPITQQTTLAAAGGKKDPLYVDDVFSTFLYEGNSSTQTITNDIDLTGEGGLVWIKSRENNTKNHHLYDTERGAGQRLSSNLTTEERDGSSNELMAFTSSGFTLGISSNVNSTSVGNYVSWTFRKAPGFFDVVTYSGTGSARTIAHNLGSVPGMIIVKVVSGATDDWFVYHRSLGDQRIKLNSTNASASTGVWNYTAPTSSVFSVGTDGGVNGSGRTYVAYIFAHDDASFGTDGDESIIKCDSVTVSSQNPQEVNLGFEPQFILIKHRDSTEDWFMLDTTRYMMDYSVEQLYANRSYAAQNPNGNQLIYPTPNGFYFNPQQFGNFTNGTYIYMAIRRSHKPPEAGTDVFHAYYGTPSNSTFITTGFPFDMQIKTELSSANSRALVARKLGLNTWYTTSNYTGKLTPDYTHEDQRGNQSRNVLNTGHGVSTNDANNLMSYHSFKSAPGFMSMTTYIGTGSSRTVDHNLSVTPELMFVKIRSGSDNWSVYHKDLGATKYLKLNETTAATTAIGNWQNTAPTSTQFTVGGDAMVGANTHKYFGLLFATLPGISKVGSYTGTGSNINIDCGFTSGARYILIKRTDSAANWHVWDYARGIVSGNDPYYKMNIGSAQITVTDYIDPLNAGFTVTSSSPAALNASGGNYIFLAIA